MNEIERKKSTNQEISLMTTENELADCNTKHITTLIIMPLRHPVYFTIGNYEFQFHSYDPACGFVLEETTPQHIRCIYIKSLGLNHTEIKNKSSKAVKEKQRRKDGQKKKRFLFCKCFFIYPFECT